MHAPHAAELEPRQRQTRVLEDEALDVRGGEAVGRDGLRVLGTQHHQELTLGHVPADIGAERGRDIRHVVEDAGGGGRDVVVDVVRGFTAEDRHHALPGSEAQSD